MPLPVEIAPVYETPAVEAVDADIQTEQNFLGIEQLGREAPGGFRARIAHRDVPFNFFMGSHEEITYLGSKKGNTPGMGQLGRLAAHCLRSYAM